MPQRGNPQLPIRLSPERRKLWEEAARIDKRTITDFVRQATDQHAKEIIRRNEMSSDRYTQKINQALEEINATPGGYTRDVIWNGEWCPQHKVCIDISYYIFKLLGGKI